MRDAAATKPSVRSASRRTHGHLRAILDAAPDAVITIDRSGQIVDWNKTAEQIFGHSRAEAIGLALAETVIPPRFREAHRQGMKRYLGGGEAVVLGRRIEIAALRADGSEFPIELAIASFSVDGAPYFTARIRDITEIKQHEKARKRADAALIQAQKLAKLGYYRWSKPLQKIVSCNDEYLQILSSNPGSSIDTESRGIEPYLHPDDRQRVTQAYRTAEAEGRPVQLEFRIVRADGLVRFIRDFSEPEPNPDGLPESWFGTIQDITDLKQQEEELAQQQRLTAIGELSGGIAHDFNNLMAIIAGNLELIQDGFEGNERLTALVQQALSAAERGAELTQRLLAFSRKQPLTPRRIDLNALIGEWMGILPRLLGATIKVNFVPSHALWPALADPGQLQAAIINLAANARDAIPDGGSLTIETSNRTLDQAYTRDVLNLRPGDYVQLSLNDTGKGMPPEIAKRAFEPFFTTKSVGKGTGLGLSMVFGFAKQSGGHIELRSEEGVGTTVHFLLPRVFEAEAAEVKTVQHSRPSSIARGACLVLLVEDEPAVRMVARAFLEGLGYQVLEAPSGPEALAILKRGEPVDVLFTDVVLPDGMNGVEIARQARLMRPGIKVLLTSGYTREIVTQENDLDAGVTLLQKPYRKRQLAEALRTLLE